MSARASTRTPGARRCSPISRMRRGCCPGRQLTSIFFGGGTPSLMEPATVAALIEPPPAHWTPRRRHRDHARGQSQFGRGRALRRSRGGGRQPPVARAAELRRRGACLPRPRPFGAGRLRGARDRADAIPQGQLRPDLRASRRHARTAGRRRLRQALALGTAHLSLYQLTIEPGTRFASMAAQRRA